MTRSSPPLKRMKLYQHVERVERALAARGLADPAPLTADALADLDQLHYEGLDAVDRAAADLGLEPGDRVLDAGSGLGGPARRLAGRHACEVTAIEIQPDLHECARGLTRRCGLDDLIEHVCGNLLDPVHRPAAYDAVVSWLVFLHIADRETLLRRCREHLKAEGGLYIEDFFQREPFDDVERRLLRDEVQCARLVDRERYIDELRAAGFDEIRFDDRSEAWAAFVRGRLDAFRDHRDAFVALQGEPTYRALEAFYTVMDRLFAGGRLGGVRVTARAV